MHETFHNAMKFANNFRRRHPEHGLSNVYVIRRIKDGEVLEELYGMNVFTSYGFGRFINDNISFPTNLYIGHGAPSPSSSVQTLTSKISDIPATVRDSTIDYSMPIMYGRNTYQERFITVSCKYLTAYFPASYAGLTEDVGVTEYGIGESADQLWTTSEVYTQYGSSATLVKHPGEELEFTVYLCMQIPANGSYAGDIGECIITTMHWFFNRSFATLKTLKGNTATTRAATNTATLLNSSNGSSTVQINPFILTKGTDDANGYIDGFLYQTDGFMFAARSEQSKSLSYLTKPDQNHIFDDQYIPRRYHDEFLPMYDITDLATKSFSMETGSYSVNLPDWQITNPNVYSNILMKKEYGVPLYMEEDGQLKTYYVYLNINHSIQDITAMNPNLTLLYGTDFYWYKPYWMKVDTPASIDNITLHPSGSSATISRLRACKYWITDTNTLDLQPNIEPSAAGRATTNVSAFRKTDAVFPTGVHPYAADFYGMMGNQVFVNQTQHTASNVNGLVSDTEIFISQSGQKFIVFTRANTTQFMVISAAASGLSYRTYPYRPNSDAVDPFNSFMTIDTPAVSSSDLHGISIVYGTNKFVFVSLRSSDQYGIHESIYDDNTLTACAISGFASPTSLGLFAHISTTDDHVVNIYQYRSGGTYAYGALSDMTPYKSFTIPSAAATPVWMFGYSNFVYVSDGATYMYVIDIVNETVTLCSGYIPWSASDIIKVRVATNARWTGTGGTVKLCVLYKYDDSDMSHAYVLKSTSPTTFTTLATLDSGVSGKGSSCCYKLTNRGQSIVLICNFDNSTGTSVINEVYDIGHWLYDGTKDFCTLSNQNETMVVLQETGEISYKNVAIYADRFLTKMLSGTTGIITTIDGSKDVTGAAATVNFTLTGGFPPTGF